ncbi:response regulator [Acuticoccus yangtzensis]|uniref:response regulator n=1 Tax=Acuticoccus yangtzensis TaxID=1443441 RepID=UPI000949B111|nr:response regulator [Acuticoccus yangtzensis]
MSNRTPRVLLVEDEALIALTLKMMLEIDMGFEVIGPIARLNEAIEAARTETLDLALLDVAIIGGEVFPVANILQERHVPIIFHTGHGLREELSGSYSGAQVLSKPVDDAVLREAMTRMISGPSAGTC